MVAWVRPVTAKVTVFVAAGTDLATTHRPLRSLVHEAVPPIDHEPVTVAPAAGAWLLSWTVIVTVGVQVPPWLETLPSRSPMWASVTVTAALRSEERRVGKEGGC